MVGLEGEDNDRGSVGAHRGALGRGAAEETESLFKEFGQPRSPRGSAHLGRRGRRGHPARATRWPHAGILQLARRHTAQRLAAGALAGLGLAFGSRAPRTTQEARGARRSSSDRSGCDGVYRGTVVPAPKGRFPLGPRLPAALDRMSLSPFSPEFLVNRLTTPFLGRYPIKFP